MNKKTCDKETFLKIKPRIKKSQFCRFNSDRNFVYKILSWTKNKMKKKTLYHVTKNVLMKC